MIAKLTSEGLAGRVERYEDTIEMKGDSSRRPDEPAPFLLVMSPVQDKKEGHRLNFVFVRLEPDKKSHVNFTLQFDDGSVKEKLISFSLPCNLKSH